MGEKQQAAGKKTWKNYYWFYYKWHMLAAIVLIATIVICTAQCAMKVDPDYYVLFYCDTYYDDQALAEVTAELEKYSTDINGDGKVKVVAVNCTYSPSDTQLMNQARQQAILQMTTDNTDFWVLNKSGAELYYETEKIDIFATYEPFDEYDSHATAAKNLKAFEKIDTFGENDFYVFCRKEKGSATPKETTAEILEKTLK